MYPHDLLLPRLCIVLPSAPVAIVVPVHDINLSPVCQTFGHRQLAVELSLQCPWLQGNDPDSLDHELLLLVHYFLY